VTFVFFFRRGGTIYFSMNAYFSMYKSKCINKGQGHTLQIKFGDLLQ